MSGIDSRRLRDCIGRSETRYDRITEAPVAALSATLDYDHTVAKRGEMLPPCWHWLYFLDAAPNARLDVDGHVRRGGFIPPIPLPRRMWAGSRLKFHTPLIVGDEARRVTTIADVRNKVGRSGELVFLTLRHQVYAHDELAIEEDQELVYRRASPGGITGEAAPAPAAPQWSREVTPDPVLLFRYSALTFNSHRIHYDREYATGTEGYASLVVQGPLTATLLLDLLRREMPGADLAAFEFRAVRPLLEGAPMTLQGRAEGDDILLWALDDAGALALSARARLAGNGQPTGRLLNARG